MKRMITALCAMMLVPTLAAAKNEGISVTELREQIETLGRWTASYTDVKGRTVEVDIAPILSEVENVPVITLEKPQYPLESAYNICDPSMTKVRQEADGGTVFNYDNPETGEQRDLYFVSAPGDSYDNVLSVIMEYRSQKIEESGILESRSGKSYRINEVDWEKPFFDGYDLTIQNAVDLANGELSRLFPNIPIDLEPIWVEVAKNTRPLYILEMRQRFNGIPVLTGANMPVKYVRDDDAPFDIPQIWERNGCYQYWADFRSPTWDFDAYVDGSYSFFYVEPMIQKDVLVEDVPLSPIQKVIESLEQQIEAGHIRNLFALRFGYCCYLNDAKEVVTIPVWMAECDYYFGANTKTRNYKEFADSPITSRLFYRTMIVNAQTGEFVDPAKLMEHVLDCPEIITWEDVQ